MDLVKIQQILDKIKGFSFSPPDVEANILSIGGRGYYENPTTDVLSFFLNDKGDHDLGSLVLSSLIDLLPDNHKDIDQYLINYPEREVYTYTGKGRIDLILEGQDWVITIENKIFNTQSNPYEDYERYIDERFTDKTKIFIVLSPQNFAYSLYVS
jgi:hypothetical protein